MKTYAIPSGSGRNDGDEHIAKLRKEQLKALRDREILEQKANEKTRRLRAARLAGTPPTTATATAKKA